MSSSSSAASSSSASVNCDGREGGKKGRRVEKVKPITVHPFANLEPRPPGPRALMHTAWAAMGARGGREARLDVGLEGGRLEQRRHHHRQVGKELGAQRLAQPRARLGLGGRVCVFVCV